MGGGGSVYGFLLGSEIVIVTIVNICDVCGNGGLQGKPHDLRIRTCSEGSIKCTLHLVYAENGIFFCFVS